MRLTATVQDTFGLRRWLRGYMDALEVLEPEGMREEMKMGARRMARLYRDVE